MAALRPHTRLTGDLVVLERVRPRHVDGLTEAINRSHAELLAFMDWMTEQPQTIQMSGEFVESSEADWDAGITFNFAMTDPATGEVIGVCGLMTRPGPKRLEIGYWVRTDRTGAGVATAAASLLTEAGLRIAGIGIVEIHHDAANVASGRIPDKLGYVEAVRREVEIDSPGECGIEVIWEITRERWLTSPARP